MASTLILWFPFMTHSSSVGYIKEGVTMLDLYSHWDGPLYVIAAKTWYNPNHIIFENGVLDLSPAYFAAHLPLYPFLIQVGSFIGYLKSMLVVPVIFAVLYLWTFYAFAVRYSVTQKPLLLTLVAAFFSPRFFVVRSVGAPETVFMFFIMASLYFFMGKRYFLSSVAGALAVATKTPGILLFFAYGLYFLEELLRRQWTWKSLYILIIPLGFAGVSLLYLMQTNDFFAYFNSGDNIHLLLPPFQMFNRTAQWVGTGWLEDSMLYLLLFGAATYTLWQKKTLRPLAYFSLVFLLAVICIEHRDIARYAIPLLPLTLIAYERFFTSRAFVVAMLLLLPALYFFGWNFMMENRAPITDWKPFQ